MRVKVFAFIIWLAGAELAHGTGPGLTYHGRLVDPNELSVVGTSVQFRLQIRTPGSEDCLLYEETQAKDLSQTDGIISITLNDGSGTRQDSSGYSMDQVFANRRSYTFAAGQYGLGQLEMEQRI